MDRKSVKKKKYILLSILLIIIYFLLPTEQVKKSSILPKSLTGRVVAVMDGDTISIQDANKKKHKIRSIASKYFTS